MSLSPRLLALLAAIVLSGSASIAAEEPGTFVLAVSLPSPTMHVGEELTIKESISNPTDHIAIVGEGQAGSTVELVNENGEDIGLYAMGIPGGKIIEPSVILNGSKWRLRPGGKYDFTLRFRPVPGYLIPGTYTLRVHRRELKSQIEIYSNKVEVTVVP